MLAATPRLARHLRWRYHRNRLRHGARAWRAPRILSLNQWLEEAWEHSLVRGGEAGQFHLLSHALFQRAVDLATDTLDAQESDNFSRGARRLLARSWIGARDWAISTRELRATSASLDTRYFATWAGHFESLCRERHWLDAASLPAKLLPELSSGSVPLAKSFVLAGFERMTSSEKRLFEALDGLGRLAGRLDTGSAEHRATARRIEASDPDEERRLAASWARERLEAQPDASVGIIVPDLARHAAEFRRSFLDTFDPLWRDRDGTAFPVSLDDGAKLADAGLVHTALLLLRVPAGHMDYREIGQLLRSPYLRGGVSEAAERARLDLVIRNGRMQVVDLRSLCRRDSDGLPREFLDSLERMLKVGEQARRRREPAAWLPLIETLLKEAGLGLGRTLGHDEERVRDAWTRILEQFATLGEVVGEISFDAARRLLSDAARDQRLRSGARTDGVQIMTPWDTAAHEFDAVWICGMTSEAWPPIARPSPLISLNLQRDRGIPEALPGIYREQALAVVDRLLANAPACVASWAGRAGEEERVASPIIAALPPIDPLPPAEIDEPCGYRHALSFGLSGPEPDPAPALTPGETVRGGSRVVDLQSACPARAFFELRLGAKELRAPPYAPDAMARGNILHDAAEYLYSSLRAAGGPAQVTETELDELIPLAVNRSLERHIPDRHPLVDTLRTNERHRLTRMLHRLVTRDRERGEFWVSEVEGTHVVQVRDIPLKVRFDRVDSVASGATLVIDYKTGAYFSISKCIGERPLQLQLPLYAAYGGADGIALYWLHADGVRIDAIGADDFGVLTSGRARKYLLDADAWAAQIGAWRDVLETLVAEFVAGDCRIDLEEDRRSRGQFAMLTRRWDIEPSVDAGCDE